MSSSFADERGTIEDILAGPIDQVTKIFTHAGAVRGNHIHRETTQWVYVVSGSLRVAEMIDFGRERTETVYFPGSLIEERPGVMHAWRAEEDTVVLVLTRGPRSGENYESDTFRLAPEDRLL